MSDPNDKLITRDPAAMEHTLEDADYGGSETVEGLASGPIEVQVGNLGGLGAIPIVPPPSNNLNPGYTPPGQQVTPHPVEGAADLPAGAPAEAELDNDGMQP